MKKDIKDAFVTLIIFVLLILGISNFDNIKEYVSNFNLSNFFSSKETNNTNTDDNIDSNIEDNSVTSNDNPIIEKKKESLKITIHIDNYVEKLTFNMGQDNRQITSEKLKKDGYTFIGWAVDKNSENVVYKSNLIIDDSFIEKHNGSLELYAVFSPNSYKISFDCNGGKNPPNSQTVYYNKDFTLTGLICEKNGFVQDGWLDENNKEWKALNYTNVRYTYNKDIKLKAKWLEMNSATKVKTYMISFDCNGGKNPPVVQVAEENKKFTLTNSICTREGYKQTGWIDQNNNVWNASDKTNIDWTYSKDIKLKAVWEAITIKVTFDSNGGTGTNNQTQTFTYGKSQKISDKGLSKKGYSLGGWALTSSSTVKNYDVNATIDNSFINSFKPSITLYAVWNPNSYTVSYDCNGGSGNIKAQTIKYNSSYTLTSSTCTRSGYTQDGWTDQDNNTWNLSNKTNIKWTYTKNITLKAKWNKNQTSTTTTPSTNQYTVTFDCNGGSGSIPNQTATYGTAFTLTSSTCTRSGYTQNGWKDQNGVAWTTSNTNNWVWSYKYNVTLKAVWKENVNRIHFISAGSSDAFLIESNGHYGLIDASNPSMSDSICTSNNYNARQHSSVSSSKVSNCISSCSSRVSSDSRTSVDHILSYFAQVGVTKLDFVIGTHTHADHIGGMKSIADSKYVDSNTKYYYRNYTITSDDYSYASWCNYEYYLRAIEAFNKKSSKLVEVTSKTPEFSLGEFTLKILNTSTASSNEMTTVNYNGKSIKTINGENKNSLVTLLKYKTKKVLFMGDTEIEDEAKLVSNNSSDISNVEVLKMGHHGSRTSSRIEFIKKAKPNYIVMPTASIHTGRNYGSIRYLEKNKNTTTYVTGYVNDAIVLSFNSNGEYSFKNSDNKTNISKAKLILNVTDINGNNVSSVKNGWEKLTFNTLSSGTAHVWLYYENNEFVTKWKKINYKNVDSWFYFEPVSGVMQKGWIQDDGYWYYLDNEGIMKTGWIELNGNWYYLNSSGRMLTGTQTINGETFVFNSSGVCISGRGC